MTYFVFPSKARVVIKEGDVNVSDSDDEDDSKYKEDENKGWLLFLRECMLNDNI